MSDKLHRFEKARLFICPFCSHSLKLEEKSLKCPNKHSFDLAKFGYINLAPQVKQSKNYDKNSFQNRQIVLQAGFYQHILTELFDLLKKFPDKQNILDSGCGEGYYAREIQKKDNKKQIYAFDLSKDSIQLAAKQDATLAVNWFVGDLSHIPICDATIDIILDIFSPANYQEFNRILDKKGLLIKVIPTHQHLTEIRNKISEQLEQKEYSNDKIVQHFKENFHLVSSHSIVATYPLKEREKEALLDMTPLLFHVNKKAIDWSDLTHITIAADIMVGRKKEM